MLAELLARLQDDEHRPSTVVLGANDHGKTNLLNAIRTLNDDCGFTSEDENWDL